MERRYLSIRECAEYLGISIPTIYRWSKEGKIQYYKINYIIRFDKLEIDRWMNKFKQPNLFKTVENL